MDFVDSVTVLGNDEFRKPIVSLEKNGVQAMLEAARDVWQPITEEIIISWYKTGGMPLVVDEFCKLHMTRQTGALKQLGLTEDQMRLVSAQLEKTGELKEILQSRILQSIAADSRYTTWESLINALADEDTVLVRGDWITQQSGGQLPRRQDLPKTAFWDHQTLAKRLNESNDAVGPVAIVAVSYCWLSSTDPDPDGGYLTLLSSLVSAAVGRLRTWRGEPGVRHAEEFNDMWMTVQSEGDIAIFIDWCSMYQVPRSEEQEESFQKSLSDIDIWFAHQGTHSWLITGLSSGRDTPKKSADYYNRGWPSFEYALSNMAKDREMILTFGHLSDETFVRWTDIDLDCRTKQAPRLTPESMKATLAVNYFSNEADRDFLCHKYEEAYGNIFIKAKQLTFRDYNVGIMEFNRLAPMESPLLREIAEMLPKCFRLQKFVLSNVHLLIGDGAYLVKALRRCRTLVHLEFRDTSLHSKDVAAVATLVDCCTALKYLLLSINNISNSAVIALANVLPQSQLSMLGLDHNLISDDGGSALASSLAFCNQLKCLTLHDNRLSDVCKEDMEAAWSLAGLPQSDLAKSWASVNLSRRHAMTAAKFESHGGLFL
jgi:hypothetical protein